MTTVLLVDDDALAGEMTAALLEMHGFEVHFYENAIDALEQLSDNSQIDIIISDMNMPMISGIELFRMLQEQHNTRPFILLTGDDVGGYLTEEPGLSACITKDASLDETLARTIQQLLA